MTDINATYAPDVTWAKARHWMHVKTECTWCEHPMTAHLRVVLPTDKYLRACGMHPGWHWKPCTTCQCVNPQAES